MAQVYDGTDYIIGGNEYEGKQHIETTMFLEICRISHIAADLLIAYKTQDKFRKSVDGIIDSLRPTGAASLFLAVQLKDAVCGLLDGWFQPNELGEETDEDSEVYDE